MREGTLLGGRVRYAQLTTGHRTGIEPVLLAASVPARAGQRVLEGGTGAGAGVLCLSHRVPGVLAVGLELEPELADLARANAVANGFTEIAIETADIAQWRAAGRFDHAFANPPWHGAGTRSPDGLREGARREEADGIALWAARLAAALRAGGTLTLVLPAGRLAEGMAALTQAGCGAHTVFPLWPRAGGAAKLVLLRGIRLGRGPCRVLPGLVLHEGRGFSAATEAVLRLGRALEFK